MGFCFEQYRKRQEFKFKGLGVTTPQALSLVSVRTTPSDVQREQRKLRKKERKNASKP